MKFLRLKEVMAITALSRSSIYKFMSEERFPQTISLGDRAVAWLESEVEEWMEEKLQSRGQNVESVTIKQWVKA
ncbi:AlpA family phage regulatory protein [Vibrio ziniensis]|uniref:AlpA family phage regulatory protein n=1 Tax=Vibrio ziniensis TaxID=2711221 RepID=A0A6G7CG75_9VIBR|nr:AlpA family phage regulatory protein [Vibrio ziniensis]QIH41102.1 AlpA family phage regulatory protein [Vibrio ziniensis]